MYRVLLVSCICHQMKGSSCRAVLGNSEGGSVLPCLHCSKKCFVCPQSVTCPSEPTVFLPGRQPAGAAFAVLGSAAAAHWDGSRGMRHCCEGCLLLLFLTASLSLFVSVISDQNIPFMDLQDELKCCAC